jgi:hypothetical protein
MAPLPLPEYSAMTPSLTLSSLPTDLVCPFSKKQLTGVRKALIPLIENNEQVRKNLTIVIAQGKSLLSSSENPRVELNPSSVLLIVPQPWHASSTLVHEAALGLSKTLVEGGKSFSDEDVVKKWQSYFFELMDKQEVRSLETSECPEVEETDPNKRILQNPYFSSHSLPEHASTYKSPLQEYFDEPTANEAPAATRARLADLAVATIPDLDRSAFLKNISTGKGNSGSAVCASFPPRPKTRELVLSVV